MAQGSQRGTRYQTRETFVKGILEVSISLFTVAMLFGVVSYGELW